MTEENEPGMLDAAVLLMPAVGFLPAADPRVKGTIRAIEKDLVKDGLVLRYKPEHTGDGLPGSNRRPSGSSATSRRRSRTSR